jgi:hypothetical protein
MRSDKIQPNTHIPLQVNKQIPGKPGKSDSSEGEVDNFVENSYTDEVGKKKNWTIFHYVSADNDLQDFLTNDVNNTERIGSTDNMHIVTMFDRGEDNCKVYYITQDQDKLKSWESEKERIKEIDKELGELKKVKNKSSSKSDGENSNNLNIIDSLKLISSIYNLEKQRFEVWKEYGPREVTSPVIKDMGETDLTDPKVFRDFVTKMAKKFPAHHYAVLISSHGSGWEGAIEDNMEQMTTPVMSRAFKSIKKDLGQKIDLVGFDACQMGAAEIAWELADSAKFMVASQEVLGGPGLAYASFLQQADEIMKSGENLSGKELANIIVDTADIDKRNIPVLSAINLQNMPKYKEAVNNFASAILDTDTPNEVFRDIVDQAQHFDDPNMKDHYHFAQLVSESDQITDNNVKDTARDLMRVIREDLIITNRRFEESHLNANGIAILIEDVISEDYRDISDIFSYRDIKLAKDSLWDEAVHKFMKKS